MVTELTQQEFQPYLDAVIKSGERTRTVLYIFVLILVGVFFAGWNTRPGNITTWRFERMLDVLVCQFDNYDAKICGDAAEYAERRHFPISRYRTAVKDSGSAWNAKQEVVKELEKRTEDLMRRELDVHVITLPILGITIDSNDTWIISNFVLLFLLVVLRASINRELDNLRRAARYARDAIKRELLIMAQLFASSRDRRRPLFFLLFLPVAMSAFNIANLFTSEWIAISRIEDTLWENIVQDLLQGLSFIAIAILCWQSFRAAVQIDDLVTQLERHPPTI